MSTYARALALRGVTRYPLSRGKRGGPIPTAFTELVPGEPIQQAAFGSLRAELVAGGSDAGGLGMIGAPTVSPDAFSAAADLIRTKTDAPVGVDFCGAVPRCQPRRPRRCRWR